jgi:hypothetical protein
MAFTCWECYKKENPKDAAEPISLWAIALKSYGPCESCRKTKECADVH